MQASQLGLDFFKECFWQYWNNRMFLPIILCVCVIFNSTANGSFGIVLSKADF